MADGILVIDKPAGWTSHDVVAKVRRIFKQQRVGHGGTLDPMATGVLPVFVGRATRAVEFAAAGDKEYHAVLRLGIVTDTQDSTGTVLAQRAVTASDDALEAVLEQFRGDILQIPPMYSAIKQDGKKLYELARAGKVVERPPRPVHIDALEVQARTGDEISLRVACSKGTYIRTLCHDIGEALGCGGAMSALRRCRAAGFDIAQAVMMDDLSAREQPEQMLLPTDSLFAQWHALTVDGGQARVLRNGGDIALTGAAEGEALRVYAPDGAFLLIGRAAGGRLHIIKRFFEG